MGITNTKSRVRFANPAFCVPLLTHNKKYFIMKTNLTPMDESMELKESVCVGKTETGNQIFFYAGGFPASSEATNGNPLFQIKK